MVTVEIRKIYVVSSRLLIDMRNLAEIIRSSQFFRYALSGVALGIISALWGGVCSAADRVATEASMSSNVPVYPLKASANNRYLVDQNNVPFMIVGDSPHSLIGTDVQIGRRHSICRTDNGTGSIHYGSNSCVTTKLPAMRMGPRLMAFHRLPLPVIFQHRTPHTSSGSMTCSR